MELLFDPVNFQFDLIDKLYFFSGILIFALGMAVCFRERGTSVGRVYFLFTVSIASWVITTSLLMAARTEAAASQFLIPSNLPVVFIPAVIFHYTRILLDQHHRQKVQILGMWFISSAFALLLFLSPDFVSAHLFEFGYYTLYGATGYLFLGYFFIAIGWTYYSFIRESLRMAHSEDSQKRSRWLSAALIASLLATADFLPVLGIDIHPVGVFFVLLLFAITTYVTWRYLLVDISSEYIANNILQIIRNPLMIIDLNGEIKLQNNIATETFKPEDLKYLMEKIRPYLDTEHIEQSNEPISIEVSIELFDFTHTYEVAISPIYSRNNSLLAYTCIFTDISVLKQYHKSLEQSRSELEQRVIDRTRELNSEIIKHTQTVEDLQIAKQEAIQASQAKSIFLSRMSHELRTPMNAILGFSQLIQLDADISQEDQKKYIEHIYKAGNHLMSLINDILDLSRIELDRLKLQPANIDITNILHDCVTYVEHMASSRDISIEIDTDSCKELQIISDQIRLKQVIINLLNNAIKYNMEHGKVLIYCKQNRTTIRISIQDTGIGIPEDTAEKVFQPFERLSNVLHDSDGAGIGLSLSKHLIEIQGGTIGYDSVEGVGSTFWFELPKA